MDADTSSEVALGDRTALKVAAIASAYPKRSSTTPSKLAT